MVSDGTSSANHLDWTDCMMGLCRVSRVTVVGRVNAMRFVRRASLVARVRGSGRMRSMA